MPLIEGFAVLPQISHWSRSPLSDAVLSCMFQTEKDQNPRIEWKKKGKDVSFVYFEGHFKGEKKQPVALYLPPPPVTNGAFVVISLH